MDHDWDDLARLFVIARGFLFRVANELLPLQADGRCVSIRRGSVVVHLRTRKNQPHGAKLVRHCACRKGFDVLGCACAVAKQVELSR